MFLDVYTGMALKPSLSDAFVVQGDFLFAATVEGADTSIVDTYHLKIEIPRCFPRDVPKVWELNQIIPRDGEHHINNTDDTLCLGSPIRLLQKLSKEPTLVGFAKRCLVPYLFAISHKRRGGAGFYFSELAHGTPGIISDYQDIFKIKDKDKIPYAMKLLRQKRRLANKHPCPCNCGRRLGKCRLHIKLNAFRDMLFQPWFRKHVEELALR